MQRIFNCLFQSFLDSNSKTNANKKTSRIVVQCEHPELHWKVTMLNFGNLINITIA